MDKVCQVDMFSDTACQVVLSAAVTGERDNVCDNGVTRWGVGGGGGGGVTRTRLHDLHQDRSVTLHDH